MRDDFIKFKTEKQLTYKQLSKYTRISMSQLNGFYRGKRKLGIIEQKILKRFMDGYNEIVR